MITCEQCGLNLHRSGKSRHIKRYCKGRPTYIPAHTTIDASDDLGVRLIKLEEENAILREKLANKEKKELEQNITIAGLENLFTSLRELVDQADVLLKNYRKNEDIKIEELGVSSSTQLSYRNTKNQYLNFAKNEGLAPESTKTMDKFVKSFGSKVSTAKKHRRILQSLYGVKLPKIRAVERIVPKYRLSSEAAIKFIAEQKNFDKQGAFLQWLMLRYTLRINTLASLKKNDLLFLQNDSNIITFPDSKTGAAIAELDEIDKKYLFELTKNYTDDDFVFFPHMKSARRTEVITKKINNLIKKTTVVPKSQVYKLSSHMLRKAEPHQLYQKELDVLKTKLRDMLRHRGTSALDFYIS